MHYRCNRVYVPWVNKGVRRTAFIRNIISKSKFHHIIVWYFGRVFKHDRKLVSVECSCYQAEFIHAGLVFTEITDNSNTIQVPVIHVSEEPAATESSRLPDKVSLVPPSVPHLARHPPLSITTHLFSSSATPIMYSISSPHPIYCTGRCREDPESDVKLKADVVRARNLTSHYSTHLLLPCRSPYRLRRTINFLGKTLTGRRWLRYAFFFILI